MAEEAFTGYVDFHLKLTALGASKTRVIRANYRYTPDWPYFDPETGVEACAPSTMTVDLQLQILPPKHGQQGLAISPDEPCWIEGGPLVILATAGAKAWATLEGKIDADARWQDQERRHRADPTWPSLAPRL